jgi:ATP-dependent DNA helicase PIF1
MPYPDTLLLKQSNNRLLQEESDYDRNSLRDEHIKLFSGLDCEQRNIYQSIIGSVTYNKGDFFFVYGHDSIERTYLWRTLICRLHSEGKIAIAIAFSGITSLLLLGGITTHSRFQILINVIDSLTCGFK